MSDFTHARVCIRHRGGYVEIQAPAGKDTWLDLSGPHSPAASDPPPKAGKVRLTVVALAGCAVGVALTFLVAIRPAALASDAFPDRFAMPAVPLPQPPASAGTGSGTSTSTSTGTGTGSGSGTGTDPFGLRSR